MSSLMDDIDFEDNRLSTRSHATMRKRRKVRHQNPAVAAFFLYSFLCRPVELHVRMQLRLPVSRQLRQVRSDTFDMQELDFPRPITLVSFGGKISK